MPTKKLLDLMEEQYTWLSYADVQIDERTADFHPQDTDLTTKFSRNVELKIPIVSAAMFSVTGPKLAIEFAKAGALSVFDRACTIEEQVEKVNQVKYHLHGKIRKPITAREDETVEELFNRKNEKGYTFDTFPVIDSNGMVKGVVTKSNFEFNRDNSILLREIMSADPFTVDDKTTIDQAYKIMLDKKVKTLPIVDGEGILKEMYLFSDVERIVNGTANQYCVDSDNRLRVGAAIGTGPEALERAAALVEKNIDVLVIDASKGATKGSPSSVFETVYELLKLDVDIVAGNVSNGYTALDLAKTGVHGIKIGQGVGSICTTSDVTGVGRPQLAAIYHVMRMLEQNGYGDLPLCADGGITYSGDILKAIGAGAWTVMMGNAFAGTDESPGEIIHENGRDFKEIVGMGSEQAMQRSREARDRYRQGDLNPSKTTPEGLEGLTPYKGPVAGVLDQYIGGIRSGLGQAGNKSLEMHRQNAEFGRIPEGAKAQLKPHGFIPKNLPLNYRN